MMQRAGAEAGFTLVELLVSVAIMAMMAAMLLSGLVTGRRVWERVERGTQAGEDVMAAQDALRTMIRRTVPQGSFNGSRPVVEFAGDATQMTFQSAAPDADGPAPPRYYRLSLSAAGDLALDSVSTLAPDPTRMTDRKVLTWGVTGLEFAYFGVAAPDNRPRWRTRWAGQGTLPAAIRVRASYAQVDRRVWPDLIAQPAATVDTLCVVERSTGQCRGRGLSPCVSRGRGGAGAT